FAQYRYWHSANSICDGSCRVTIFFALIRLCFVWLFGSARRARITGAERIAGLESSLLSQLSLKGALLCRRQFVKVLAHAHGSRIGRVNADCANKHRNHNKLPKHEEPPEPCTTRACYLYPANSASLPFADGIDKPSSSTLPSIDVAKGMRPPNSHRCPPASALLICSLEE